MNTLYMLKRMRYVPLLQVSLFQVSQSHTCTDCYKGRIPILQVSYTKMHVTFSLISYKYKSYSHSKLYRY